MKFNFLALVVLTASCKAALVKLEKRCHGTYFDDRYYEIEVLKDSVPNVTQVIYNQNDNSIYFLYDSLLVRMESRVGYMNLETKVAGTIEGIMRPKAIAIDQVHNDIYIAGHDGLHRLNEWKVPIRLPVDHPRINNLFYKEGLYYLTNTHEAYRYINTHGYAVEELAGALADSVVVDGYNEIFFVYPEEKTLYRVRLGTRAVNIHERLKPNFLTVDTTFRAFAVADDGVFRYIRAQFGFQKISGLKGLKGLTFNKFAEPIYTVDNVIYKMNYRSEPCIE